MAKAYICDRCGDSHTGESGARVFLSEHRIDTSRGRSSPALAQHQDLCQSCTSELEDEIKRRAQR